MSEHTRAWSILSKCRDIHGLIPTKCQRCALAGRGWKANDSVRIRLSKMVDLFMLLLLMLILWHLSNRRRQSTLTRRRQSDVGSPPTAHRIHKNDSRHRSAHLACIDWCRSRPRWAWPNYMHPWWVQITRRFLRRSTVEAIINVFRLTLLHCACDFYSTAQKT